MSTIFKSVFENKEIVAKLADVHDKYVVPGDKASDKLMGFFLARSTKTYYIQCLIK